MWLNSVETRLCESSKTICSAWSTSSGVSPGRSQPSRAISPPDADQAAQGRHLADDLRVVRRVRRRRDERRELVDPLAAAGVLELAALLELVDERDRVDRLAARVQRERRAVDLRVALAVEVARVEDLADRPDRAGGEHHRAEDGLLGVEILRRDRGGLRGLGELGHVGISGGWKRQLQRVDNPAPRSGRTGRKAAACRVRERMFGRLSPACRTSSPGRRTDLAREFRAVSGFFVNLSTGPGQGLWRIRLRSCDSSAGGSASARRRVLGRLRLGSGLRRRARPRPSGSPLPRPPVLRLRAPPRSAASASARSASAAASAAAASAASASSIACELLLRRQLAALGDDERRASSTVTSVKSSIGTW